MAEIPRRFGESKWKHSLRKSEVPMIKGLYSVSLFVALAFVGCGGSKQNSESGAASRTGSAAVQQTAGANLPAKQMQGADLNDALIAVKDLPGNTDEVVDGTRRFNGWFFKANKITFKSGSTLLFTKQALDNRRQFFIIAKELVVEDQNSPGTITWEKGGTPDAPASGGQAPNGQDGRGDGGGGLTGNPGTNGATGYAGNDAPSIVLIVMTVPSSAPMVELSGSKGGKGGQGQKGGTGGHGAKGNDASQNACNCNRGAGNGGPGGSGGPGGIGGTGGRGGNGGSFTLISSTDMLPSLSQKFRIQVSGGPGGDAAEGGFGGDGGNGGDGGGQQLPYCRGDGSHGPTGGSGSPGATGIAGPSGSAGDFMVGGITKDQFTTYVWAK
jgi:hypothetical protein